MKNIILVLFLIIGPLSFAQEKNIEIKEYRFIVDSIYSDKIKDYRTIKIYLPDEYSEDIKYPVIYTLDGDWMFMPLVEQSKILMDFDIIPKSIIIGVFHDNYKKRNSDLSWNWETGQLTESSSFFYEFLIKEIVPLIDTQYSSSGFNTLVGHSNSATFSHIILTTENQPFNGILALSQNLSKSQLEKYVEFTKLNRKKNIFYFVASGENDNSNRLKSGMKLDSIFKVSKVSNLHTKHLIYDAEHNSIVGKGLKDGIEHIFSMYKHYSGENINFIDSLHSKNINLIDFIENHITSLKKTYGLQTKVALNHNDTHFLSIGARNKQELLDVLNYHKKKLGVDEWFYFSYAQLFEYKGFCKESLKYWLKNLEGNYERDSDDIFSLKRIIELVYKKMKEPNSAIKLAAKWKEEYPQFGQNINYWIAKIAFDNKTYKSEGKKAIRDYIKNYDKPEPIDLNKAKELELELKK